MVEPLETWRDVVGFAGRYEVSSLGRIRSLDMQVKTKNRWGEMVRPTVGRILKCTPNSQGYLQVTLCDESGTRHQMLVHWVVAAAFIGPRPFGMYVLHGNDVKADCRAENLSYGSCKQNSADAIANGRQPRGERQGSARLTAEAVRHIRSSRATNEVLAGNYRVSESTVAAARRGESWAHVHLTD